MCTAGAAAAGAAHVAASARVTRIAVTTRRMSAEHIRAGCRFSQMLEADPPEAVARGQEALLEGSWGDAKHAFEQALRAGESPAALDGYAQATRWLGEASASLDARERAFRAYREAGDSAGAARSAAWLAYDHAVFRGDAAVATGWFS